MPTKSKRKQQLESAREAKKLKRDDFSQEVSADSELNTSALLDDSGIYISDEDEMYDPDVDDQSDMEAKIHRFSQEWVESLNRDDTMALSMFLHSLMVFRLQFSLSDSAKMIGELLGFSDRTIREWRSIFINNEGSFPDSEQGKYQRSGVLWKNEELNKKAREFVQTNASVKGKKNLTAVAFCSWVNEVLLVNSVLEPGSPRKLSISTTLHWLCNLGFEVIKKKKGTYVDGHEREDVIDYRQKFLRKMIANGFLNRNNMPMPSIESAFPSDLESPPDEVIQKTVIIFHDESTFQANDEENWIWGERGQCVLKPKSRGSSIMVIRFHR